MKLEKIEENESYETYMLQDDSIEDLLDECLKRIRAKSMAYYEKQIRRELSENGKALIDHHAGMGICYKVKLL